MINTGDPVYGSSGNERKNGYTRDCHWAANAARLCFAVWCC